MKHSRLLFLPTQNMLMHHYQLYITNQDVACRKRKKNPHKTMPHSRYQWNLNRSPYIVLLALFFCFLDSVGAIEVACSAKLVAGFACIDLKSILYFSCWTLEVFSLNFNYLLPCWNKDAWFQIYLNSWMLSNFFSLTKKELLRRLYSVRRYFVYRKGLLKVDFIQVHINFLICFTTLYFSYSV